MERVSVLLKPETIKQIDKEAKEKSISRSAIIRQRVEGTGNINLEIRGSDLPDLYQRGKGRV